MRKNGFLFRKFFFFCTEPEQKAQNTTNGESSLLFKAGDGMNVK